MKRILAICFLLLAVAQLTNAQTITVNGTVKDNLGNYLHFAFVQDKQYKYATYTDSVGNFTLSANPSSKLAISCYGYKDTLVDVNNKTNFALVLYPKAGEETATASPQDNTDMSKRASLNSIGDATGSTAGSTFHLGGGSIFPSFNHKDATEGSRYLFAGWVHGYVVDTRDSIIQNPLFYFNYDKMGGGLLLSQDRHSAIEVNREQIKAFTLYDEHNASHTFANMPDVDPKHYVELLSSGKKYKIYRTLKTKFVKADFSTNGIASTGNNFDSYQDTYEYFVLNLQNNSREKLELKRKSIKNDFANEPEKVNKYIADHSSDSIDESYLSNLGSYMNE